LSRSIAWSQYTFSASGAAEWDDVADLDVLAIDHDAIDEQLNQRTSLSKIGLFESLADRLSEVFDACAEALQVIALRRLRFEHLLLA
jgi:hypothetical protein